MTEAVAAGDPSLRFEILGRLRGWRGDQELDLGPGKQRAVLAVLLLNANRPTPTAKIVDAVWRDDPPENGANVVQKYVAGLRRVLEPGRSPRTPWRTLTLDDAGYALQVEPGSLDADVFQERVEQARDARSQSRPADALEHLRMALALWHGQALAGLNGPVFDAARDRLTDDRAGALEACAEIELELGQHSRLVPELVRLVAEFPVREQLRCLLILALYRNGRQAEALAAFRDARRFLTEEFGVEPGERLQRLHLSILRSDPALAVLGEANPPAPAAKGPSAVPVRPAPRLLPPDAASWTPVTPAAIGPAPELERPWVPLTTTGAPVLRSERLHRRPWPRRIVAAAIPLGTFGMFSWAVITYFAARRRSAALALAAAGYFLLTGLVFFALDTPEGTDSARDNVGVLAMLLTMAGGAVHAALLVSWPRRHPAAGRFDRRTAETIERRVRREQALSLLRHYPVIARELQLGRPDLPRLFDDGGLVDVNAVPEPVLAALPGITAHQAQRIAAGRRAQGGFTSVEELIARGLLAAPAAQALRDTLIVVPPDPAAVSPSPTADETDQTLG